MQTVRMLAARLHRAVTIGLLLGLASATSGVEAGGDAGAAGPEATTATLRVGTSGDYAPFSLAENGAYHGFDIAVAEAFAAAHGLRIEWVRFRWPELLADLEAGRFDVAMSGITVRPERSLAGAFTVPVVTSGAVALVPGDGPLARLDQLDGQDVRIAVNLGGHLERVTRARFPAAEIVAMDDNAAVPDALAKGRVHAVVSDDMEAPVWEQRLPGVRRLGPFTRDSKAYLVSPERRDLAGELDAWLLEREADGTLQQLRAKHLGRPAAEPPPTAPLPALVASMQERLALMPAVAETKRRSGTAVHAPAQEERVLDAAVAASWASAAVSELAVPDAEAVRGLFRAQMAAARAIQTAVLAGDPQREAPAADITALRAALGRIGDRIAGLLPFLPLELPMESARSMIAGLQLPGLDDELRSRLARALAEVATAPRSQP